MAVLEKDGRTSVAAFDRAVEVVPLVNHADGVLRILDVGERTQTFGASDLAQECEDTIENAAIGARRDEVTLGVAQGRFCDGVTVLGEIGRRAAVSPYNHAKRIDGADQN